MFIAILLRLTKINIKNSQNKIDLDKKLRQKLSIKSLFTVCGRIIISTLLCLLATCH